LKNTVSGLNRRVSGLMFQVSGSNKGHRFQASGLRFKDLGHETCNRRQ
jgi:hypothetical protein